MPSRVCFKHSYTILRIESLYRHTKFDLLNQIWAQTAGISETNLSLLTIRVEICSWTLVSPDYPVLSAACGSIFKPQTKSLDDSLIFNMSDI